MEAAKLISRAQLGIEAPEVTIEVLLTGGLPTFNIVGLAEAAVRESKDRVRGAIISSGFSFPQERITVSLSPADMKKTGGRFDLPIALGILAAGGGIPADSLAAYEFYGELGLDGEIRTDTGGIAGGIEGENKSAAAVFMPIRQCCGSAIVRGQGLHRGRTARGDFPSERLCSGRGEETVAATPR